MTDAELADIMAMDALTDSSRSIRLSNPDPVDIQNLKAILVLANSAPNLVRELREERLKLASAKSDAIALTSESGLLHVRAQFAEAEIERLKMEPHRHLLGLMVKVFGDTAKYPGEVDLVREAKELLK